MKKKLQISQSQSLQSILPILETENMTKNFLVTELMLLAQFRSWFVSVLKNRAKQAVSRLSVKKNVTNFTFLSFLKFF